MAFVKIYIHAVWGTKNRFPYLKDDIRKKVISHILFNAKQKEIEILELNGYQDHLHCLLKLKAEMPISKDVNLLKGESSFWINKENICPTDFKWAAEYYATSVSESDLPNVRRYIQNQEEHHRNKTFIQIYENFMEDYDTMKTSDQS